MIANYFQLDTSRWKPSRLIPPNNNIFQRHVPLLLQNRKMGRIQYQIPTLEINKNVIANGNLPNHHSTSTSYGIQFVGY